MSFLISNYNYSLVTLLQLVLGVFGVDLQTSLLLHYPLFQDDLKVCSANLFFGSALRSGWLGLTLRVEHFCTYHISDCQKGKSVGEFFDLLVFTVTAQWWADLWELEN